MKKKKILLIEDDVPTVHALTYVLKRRGLEVVAARSGEEAWRRLGEEKPDLLAVDLKLVGLMSGYDLIAKLRQDPAAARLPVIIISNFGLQPEIERGRSYGVADYIVKSEHSIHEIADRISQVA
jgi:DNA-binding response OmpR family regulator